MSERLTDDQVRNYADNLIPRGALAADLLAVRAELEGERRRHGETLEANAGFAGQHALLLDRAERAEAEAREARQQRDNYREDAERAEAENKRLRGGLDE